MKKPISLTTVVLFTTTSIFAQIGGIEDSVNDVSQTVRSIFPIILGVIFLIEDFFNQKWTLNVCVIVITLVFN